MAGNLENARDLGQGIVTESEIQAKVEAYAPAMGASDIMTAIKTVDGSGSGLDADTLDGQQGSYYQQALISGTNIKTINNTSLLGSGNIDMASIPSMTGLNTNNFLTTDGTNAIWGNFITPLSTGSSSVYDTGNVTHNTTGEVVYRTWTSQASGTATFTFVNIENSNGYGYTRVRQNGNQVYYNQTTTSNTTTINLSVNAGDTFTMSGWGSYAGNGTSRTNIQTDGAVSLLPQFK